MFEQGAKRENVSAGNSPESAQNNMDKHESAVKDFGENIQWNQDVLSFERGDLSFRWPAEYGPAFCSVFVLFLLLFTRFFARSFVARRGPKPALVLPMQSASEEDQNLEKPRGQSQTFSQERRLPVVPELQRLQEEVTQIREEKQLLAEVLKQMLHVSPESQKLRQLRLARLQSITTPMSAQSSCDEANSSSVSESSSWIRVPSEKCCYHPETIFTLLKEEGQVLTPVLTPAQRLFQGAKVVATKGRITEVLHPPEQHQVPAVIELQAGAACLVVTPDHRILVPESETGKTAEVEAKDLKKGSEVPGHL